MKLLNDLKHIIGYYVKIKTENKEKCVCCGSITSYNKNDNISIRENYIEGAGQLCDECFIKIYGGK